MNIDAEILNKISGNGPENHVKKIMKIIRHEQMGLMLEIQRILNIRNYINIIYYINRSKEKSI